MNNINSIYGSLYNDEKYKSSQFHYMGVIQKENKDDDNINNSLNNYYNNDLNNGYYNGGIFNINDYLDIFNDNDTISTDNDDDDDDDHDHDHKVCSIDNLKTPPNSTTLTMATGQSYSVMSKSDISHDSASHLPLSSPEDVKLIYGHYYPSQFKDDVLLDRYAESVDRYGFEVNKGKKEESKSFDNKRTEKKKKEIERSQKWANWLTKSKSISRSGKYGETTYQFIWDKKFVGRVYKGIPNPWRSKVWRFMLTTGQNEAEYDRSLIHTYKALLSLSSAHENYIDLDVPRTLQSHIMFKTRYGPGQRSMFNVLKAFSNYDQQVGFCQGMANVVATLLLYYSEEDSFVMLIKLFSKCNLHSLYVPGFPSLMEGFYIQKKLMELYVPKLTNRFAKLGITSTSYATKWYMTLFSTDIVAHNIFLRFWDLLMLNGFDILYYIAIALLIYNQSKLLKAGFDSSMKISLNLKH